MKFTDLEKCPKCGKTTVCARHELKDNTWAIRCICGFGTKKFATRQMARISWDKMVAEMQKG